MPTIYAKAFSATGKKMAPGQTHDAGIRTFEGIVTPAEHNGGGNAIAIARVREHTRLIAVEIQSDVTLAGVNFQVGVKSNPTKYADAVAGPAANAVLRIPVKVATQLAGPLMEPEEILITPSIALPAAANIIARVIGSHF